MSSSPVILASEYDATKVSYTAPRQLTNGGKSIFINFNGGMLRVQTPSMKTPFGVSVWPGDNGGPDKYNVNFSFEGREVNEPIKQFYDLMSSLDQKLVTDADINSLQWFKKKYPSIDVIQALYTPCVRYGKDKNTGVVLDRYAPTLKLNLPTKDGKFDFPVFGPNRTPVDLAHLITTGSTKGVRMQAIIQATGINLIAGNNFSVSWKVRQLQIMELNTGLGDSYAFRRTGDDDDDDDLEGMKSSAIVSSEENDDRLDA